MEDTTQNLDRIFHALADPTRRAILQKILEEEYSVTELAEPFAMSLAAVSKHIKVLEKAGLLRRTREGKIHWCAANPEPLNTARTVLEKYCQTLSENPPKALELF